MAIASTDPEPSAPTIIFTVVRISSENLPELERRIRQNDFVILQKKQLDVSVEESKPWFEESAKNESVVENMGYVLQKHNAERSWEQLKNEMGEKICGIASNEDLRHFFPGVVTDQYLLEPAWVSQYLNQLKPTLMAGLAQVCIDKPKDPVQYLANFLENTGK